MNTLNKQISPQIKYFQANNKTSYNYNTSSTITRKMSHKSPDSANKQKSKSSMHQVISPMRNLDMIIAPAEKYETSKNDSVASLLEKIKQNTILLNEKDLSINVLKENLQSAKEERNILIREISSMETTISDNKHTLTSTNIKKTSSPPMSDKQQSETIDHLEDLISQVKQENSDFVEDIDNLNDEAFINEDINTKLKRHLNAIEKKIHEAIFERNELRKHYYRFFPNTKRIEVKKFDPKDLVEYLSGGNTHR